MTDSARLEKLALLGIAGIAIISLTIIGLMTKDATVLGMVATGLIACAKDIVAAIRGYTMSAQLGKVTDQLAASGPVATEESK